MFDTMTLTKAVGALCGSLLVFLMVSWGASALFTTHAAEHGGEEMAQAYSVDTGVVATDAAPAEEGPPFAELLAAADVGAGEKVFGKCAACHKLDGADAVGPHLNGVVDRPKASVPGFGYSEAILALTADSWTPENLSGFLENPKKYMPGTKMSFAGLPKPQDRANVIAYLATTK
jgi:cytochrome c